MPSGSPKMTIRQGCEHVTVDSGSGTVSNVSCCQVPPPGGTKVPTSTTNTTTTASTSKIEGLQRRDSNSDLRNGNVKLQRSCSDLVRLPRSCRNVKMGRCDLRLGNCDVSLGTGDIILGTGEILKSNGEIYQLNGNVRTLSCNSVKSHSTLRRTKSSCVKGTTSDHRHAKAHNTHNTNCPNSPLTSSKRSGGKGESVNKQTSNKHKNLRNRRHSLNASSSKANTVNSEKVRCEPVNMEISDICSGSSSDVNIASSNEVLTNCNDCLPSTSSDITSCTEKDCPALVDDHLDNVSELMDQLPSCASTSLSSTSSCTTNSHAPSSIDMTNCCENTPAMPASPSLSDAKRQTSDGGGSGVTQKSRPRIRRSQSDFLKSNRKLRRASVSIQEDGNVKVIMHGQATNTTSMLSLPTTSVTTSVPTTKTRTSRKGSLPNLETQQNSDVDDTKELCTRSANGVDQISGSSEPEVESENGCTPTENDATPAEKGSTTPREIPKWKQRPHPLIPDPERHSRPWWEASADDETDTESLLEDVGFSRSSSLSSLASLLHPPPDYVATSEMSLLLQTLRHHYLFKVYMPMYRLLHLQSRRNDREEIRRKLAMGVEEEYYGGERMYKKPNLQTRLQSGMNLQICFMNEATSDVDSINGDDPAANPKSPSQRINSEGDTIPAKYVKGSPDDKEKLQRQDGGTDIKSAKGESGKPEEDEDFFAKQAKLQDEARMALAQVRPMAHMQLEVEKQMRKKSPIAEMVGIPALGAKKKLGRYLLSEMNVAQLQVVVNDLHSQIETLNEELVMMLVGRDDLHMEQDSMLVDIEDHHRRALEVAAKVNKPKRTNNKKK